MRFVLILMVKNESQILRRCLESVEHFVDAFCIHDTGSTDTTRDIAEEFLKTHVGCLTTSEWKNFGHNRTRSFEEAHTYVRDTLKWDLKETYGLLLDGDMVFVPCELKKQTLGEVGYSVLQCAGNLEYPNTRLVRMDYGWVCRGVTHEYWDGPSTSLPKSVCYIDDRNDGGCKSDKFVRDARLLEEGLEAEPTNVRYMFYLAQTYHSLGRYKDSIAMYKKRIQAGGWFEEVWYSHYMIGQCYLSLKDPIRFEAWMLRAHTYRPERAEPLYKLTRHFREVGQQHKAYHYLQKGRNMVAPNDSLFVEKDVYSGLFDYEATILNFYVGRRKEGLRESVEYLVRKNMHTHGVFQNLPFYIDPLPGTPRNHPILRDACGRDYHPTSTCVFSYKGNTYHNVRFVNYDIDYKTGSYTMKEGKYADHHKVRTQNALWTPNETIQMKDESVTLARKDKHILGLEDVRVYTNKAGELCFTATTAEYSDKIRVLQGRYHPETAIYSQCRVLESPRDRECEKNWIPIPNSDDIIYQWHPMEIGKIVNNKLALYSDHPTPSFFEHLRGSAVPFRVGDELWCLVHFVEYTTPRKYYHCFVSLNATSYRPLAISLPIVFRERTIEYCIGATLQGKNIEFVFSTMDNDPCIMDVPMSYFEWVQV